MTPNVEPEEAEAILSLMGGAEDAPPEVCDRDFSQPRRLSAAALEDLQRLVEGRLKDLEEELSGIVGEHHSLELEELGEADVDGAFGELEAPLAAVRFLAGGQPGWALWDVEGAVRCVERTLGSRAASGVARRFSPVEASLLEGLLALLVNAFGEVLEIAAETFEVALAPEELGTWRDVEENADPHRLRLTLAYQGPGGPSTIRVYLPGLQGAGSAPVASAAEAGVPGHLSPVEVEVTARLAGCQVSLSELLALEEGDVIPIEAKVDEPAYLAVEGRVFATVRMGVHRGQLAVRIEELAKNPEGNR